LGKSESATYSLGAGLRWTPFDFGAIRSRIKASEARAQGSLASYEQPWQRRWKKPKAGSAETPATRNAPKAC
jgi:outer membrane protein, multidrug efflux system